jgi:hypothetical protein
LEFYNEGKDLAKKTDLNGKPLQTQRFALKYTAWTQVSAVFKAPLCALVLCRKIAFRADKHWGLADSGAECATERFCAF